jgi:hypothetical protein
VVALLASFRPITNKPRPTQVPPPINISPYLSLLFDLLLFFTPLVLPLRQQPLRQQLFRLAGHHQIHETVVGVFDVGVTECAQSQMGHGTIVENLGAGVGVMDRLLEMRHQY